jgi:hypothetical protein
MTIPVSVTARAPAELARTPRLTLLPLLNVAANLPRDAIPAALPEPRRRWAASHFPMISANGRNPSALICSPPKQSDRL